MPGPVSNNNCAVKIKETAKDTSCDATWALAGNTLACGLATTLYFGTTVGLCCMAAHAALAQLNKVHEQKFWFSLNKRVVEDVKDYWKDSPLYFTTSAVSGAVMWFLGTRINQVALGWLRNSLVSPLAAFRVIFTICVVAPIVEETIFRGFLQEKIRDIQACIWGKEADSIVHRSTRAVLQAIPFAAAHYHHSQGSSNVLIVSLSGLMGFFFAQQKELTKAGHLWRSTAMHAHVNTAVSARTIAFGV